ncbi:replicative DNA helicase [Mycoplasmoides genitalium]|uniref:replicative DNA helicase n=1 Tax=Mycoplasmoides genitalium TaxID=2097 RepID=UPI00027B3406|nr:replicative DNA helicase [Mycoplasmoides genitalium]AFQ02910.1 replicative DNA helicase [Mycoplasmoides genitalium M2321]AFQ04400.1 replicative DNA helicase [Mycoplasmoides genitalium M2288]
MGQQTSFKYANDSNIERAERRLMQAVAQNSEGIDLIFNKLEPIDFFATPFKLIFQTAKENYQLNNPIIGSGLLEAVKFKLDANDQSTKSELELLFTKILLIRLPPNQTEIKTLVDVVKKASIFRRLQQFAKRVYNEEFKLKEDRFEGYLQAIQDDFVKIIHSAFSNIFAFSYDEIANQEEALIKKVHRGELIISGLSSGFLKLDQLTSGWKPGELIVIAARPGRGKTALLINFMASAAKQIDPKTDVVLFFSLEMRNREIYQRHLMHESQTSYTLTNRQRINNVFEELMEASSRIKNLPIKLFDYSSLTLQEIRNQITEVSKTSNVRLVIIDYLQLVNALKNNYGLTRQQEVTMISQSLKAFAKEFNTPIIAAAQLSRRIEERKDSRPILSDLRESGSIEQDADMVLFIHRTNDDKKEQEEENTNLFEVELILEKNRNGPNGKVKLNFRSDTSSFISQYSPSFDDQYS